MPSDTFFKALNLAHRGLVRVSRNRYGHIGLGMPVLALTTTGALTGRSHTVMLTAPIHENGRYVVVASRWGDSQDPAWLSNLRANPEVEVTVKGRRRAMRARIASAKEHAELWTTITSRSRIYANHQRRTERVIPVVVLEPV